MRKTRRRPNNECVQILPPPPTQSTIMREISRVVLSPFSTDLRFLLCEHAHASLRPRIQAQRRIPLSHTRNAHNLSDRFKSLENKLRPERPIEKTMTPVEETLDVSQAPNKPSTSAPEVVEMEQFNLGGSKSILRPKPRTFKGVLIPVKPPPPAADGKPMFSSSTRHI